MEVGGGEEKRLGGSSGERFFIEGSGQYRPLRGSCRSAKLTKHKSREIYSSTKREITFWIMCAE